MAETWCIAGGEQGSDIALAEALLRRGHTVAIVGHDVAPYALLVDDYADAIMPVEITAHTAEALEEARSSIELSLGEVTHFAVLLGARGEGSPEHVAGRLVEKLRARKAHPGASARPLDDASSIAVMVLVRDDEAGNAELEQLLRAGLVGASPFADRLSVVSARELLQPEAAAA